LEIALYLIRYEGLGCKTGSDIFAIT